MTIHARLTACAAIAAILVGSAATTAHAQSSPSPLRVYVVVLDGLKPSEVGPLTPRLTELKDQGTWYEQARAVFPAETLPNHAAMMTGVPPRSNGIVGNDFWYPDDPVGANPAGATKFRMEKPGFLQVPTLTTRLEDSCTASTASLLSKDYLWGLFRGETPPIPDPDPTPSVTQRQADVHWDPASSPAHIGNPDEHTPDVAVMSEAVLPWVDSGPAAPQFTFVNLGDIDRSGHVDETGVAAPEGLSAARRAAITNTDTQIGRFEDELKNLGVWDESIVIFTSDHGMDWSPTDNLVGQFSVNITPKLTQAGYTQDALGHPGTVTPASNGDFLVVPGGGSAAVYVEDPADIDAMAQLVDSIPGVAFVATPTSVPALNNPTLAEMGLDNANNGDVVAFVEKGYAVRDNVSLNPLPGNHGHPATQHSTLLVSGGSSLLDEQPQSVGGEVVYDPVTRPFAPPAGGPGNLSVAPTVAALFGLGPPAGGYDRGPLSEAFDPYALAAHTSCEAGQPVGRVISIDDQTITEGDTGSTDATFTVTVSPAPDVPLSVNFATATGTAGAADFGSRSGQLNFAVGDPTETITVPVIGDTIDESNEEFFVDLANASSGTVVDSRGTGTIVDDDTAPQGQVPPQQGGSSQQGGGAGQAGSRRTCAGRAATVTGEVSGSVTHLAGTPGPDVIVGTPRNDVIVGLGGRDLICGGAGGDLVLGNRGRDVLRGNKGDDVLRGNGGPDSLLGNGGKDRLDGGRGTDGCKLGPGQDLAAPRSC